LASSEQKVSKQTRSATNIVPRSFLGSAKHLDTLILSILLVIQLSASSELATASSMPLASELQVDSSVLNGSSNSRLDQQHTQNHYHEFGEQKLHVQAEIASEQNLLLNSQCYRSCIV